MEKTIYFTPATPFILEVIEGLGYPVSALYDYAGWLAAQDYLVWSTGLVEPGGRTLIPDAVFLNALEFIDLCVKWKEKHGNHLH